MPPRFVSFLGSALLFTLAGCERERCVRDFVDRSGYVGTRFDTGLVPELLVLDRRATVKVFAPLETCSWDEPTFTAELLDTDNLAVGFETSTIAVNEERAASIEVTFTPAKPGTHLLSVRFEPNLGARTLVLLVAGPVNVDAGAVVPVVLESCSGIWPVGDDAVVCATAQDFTVTFADGGTQRIAGRDVATSDEAVWSVSPADQLERFALINGTLQRTHVWSQFGGAAIAGLHTSTRAVRRQVDRVTIIDVSDGGDVVNGYAVPEPPPMIFASAGNGRIAAISPRGCVGGTCSVQAPPLGVEADAVWATAVPESFVRAWTFGDMSSATPTLLIDRPAEPVLASGPFELLPLWVESTLVGFAGGRLSAAIWPRDRVLKVGSRAVVLSETVDSVRVVPR